jgi:putative hydrolase of HD superfamily
MVLPFDGDRCKAVKMAVVHDLAESEIGDLITKENWAKCGTISAADKAVLEKDALEKMLSNLDKKTSDEIMNLWNEYGDGKTSEAVFVKDIDAAERMIQAYRYDKDKRSKKTLHGFWDHRNIDKIKNESIKTLVKNIIGLE